MIYKRFLLKLSGEVLAGNNDSKSYCTNAISKIASEIANLCNTGFQIGLVVGGGNIYRGGRSNLSVKRTSGDYMGMMATIMNAIALRDYLECVGVKVKIHSSIALDGIIEKFDREKVLKHFKDGYTIIFSAGTGHPFFTTDTAAVLRAIESKCEAVLKGTKVSGVYNTDPKEHQNAKCYKKITYQEIIDNDLKIMDLTAISLAKEHKLPIIVFDITKEGQFEYIARGNSDNYTIIN